MSNKLIDLVRNDEDPDELFKNMDVTREEIRGLVTDILQSTNEVARDQVNALVQPQPADLVRAVEGSMAGGIMTAFEAGWRWALQQTEETFAKAREALDVYLKAEEWYQRCRADVEAGRVVRGYAEAAQGATSARQALIAALGEGAKG
jgi:hypothetical protein